jgi:hypothetical protein
LIEGGMDAWSCGRARLIASTVDNVCAGLTLDLDQHSPLIVEPAGERRVFGGNDRAPNVTDPDGRAVAICDDEVLEPLRSRQLVVSQQAVSVLTAVEDALRLVDRACGQRGADRLEVEALGGELSRIDLDADRWVLGGAAYAYQPDDGHLRQLLCQNAIRVIADLGQRQRVRG